MQNSLNPQRVIDCKNVAVYYPPVNSIYRRGVNKEGFWAVKDISFELNKNDVLGLIGHNGAGKSTILSVINHIIEPDKGTINTYNHTTMLLSINAGMSGNLSGRKNIYLMGLTLGIPKTIIDERIEEIIDFTDIRDFIDKPISTYSSGMKTRLGFSTALYLEPEIFLVDEALGVGDKDFRKKSSAALKEKLSKNSTAIIASHNEKTIKELCNKALLIENGKSIAFGTPVEVFKQYNK